MDTKKLSECLGKARLFLERTQQENGSWSMSGPFSHKEPPHFQKEIVLTTEAISALMLINNKDSLVPVGKALNFCSQQDLSEKDPVDLWAWKATALSMAQTELCRSSMKAAVSLLEKQQMQDGCWPSFPSTYNLTNYSVLYAIRRHTKESILKKARAWLLKNKAKDGAGWGFNHESAESEVSYTGNVVFALALIGEDLLRKELQNAREFLESRQLPDGGWPSSKTTVAEKPTTYGTAFAVICLTLLSENPASKIIERGVKYLLSAQNEDGGWPLLSGGKSEFYTTHYAVYALAFYRYLKNCLENPKYSYLLKWLKPQELAQFLLQNLEDKKHNWINYATAKSALTERMLGSTFDAIMRRKDILKVLSAKGNLANAEIIDALKEDKKYEHLNKRSHITLIKNDLDHLKSLYLVFERDYKYFIVADLLGE